MFTLTAIASSRYDVVRVKVNLNSYEKKSMLGGVATVLGTEKTRTKFSQSTKYTKLR